MKVGIVTIYDYFNHGNRLQNYALEQIILNKGKHEVKTFAITANKAYPAFWRFAKCFPFFSRSKRIISSIKATNGCLHQEVIDKFSFQDLQALAKEYDCFVIGSDQVWNPRCIVDKNISFLHFADKKQCISYAPSFGVSKIKKEYEDFFKKGLSHIEYLSVREIEGQKIIKGLTGRDSELVLDPTLLLNKEDWSKFSKSVKKKPKKYIATYFFGMNKEYKKKIKAIAKAYNLKIVNINSAFDKCYSKGPREFIDILSNAELVCTNTFHGHAMSVALEKPFVSFSTFRDTNSRISTLLKLTGLQDRNYVTVKEEDIFNVNFEKVNERLQGERERSIGFLISSFKCVEGENK